MKASGIWKVGILQPQCSLKLFYFHISNLQNTWSFRKTNSQILESFTQFTHPKISSTTASVFMWLFYENNTFLKASRNSPVLAQSPLGAFSFHWSFQLFTISTFQKPEAFAKLIHKILRASHNSPTQQLRPPLSLKFFYFHISNLQNSWSFHKTNLQILESFTQFTHPKFITTTAFGFVKLFYENNTFLEASHNSLVLTQDPQGAFNFHWSFQLFHTSNLPNAWSFQLFIMLGEWIVWSSLKFVN